MDMNNDKVKYLIDLINDMDIKDKLRLAIRINETVYTNIDYDKKEMVEKFENRLKELDNEYGKYLYINQYILMVTAKITELTKEEQNQVVIYLFNTIEKICIKWYNICITRF